MVRLKSFIALISVCLVAFALWCVFVFSGQKARAQVQEPALILYSEEGFQGRSLVVKGSLLDMPKEKLPDGTVFDWNDNVRSIVVVSGTWRLYQHGRFNTELDKTPLEALDISEKNPAAGWSTLVSAGSQGEVAYPNGKAGGWGTDISSIELVSPTNLPDWALYPRNGTH